MIGEKRRKSDGTNSTSAPESRQEPLGRPEEPGEQVHPGLGEQRVEVDEERAEHLEVLEVVALAERVQEGGRLAGPERDAQRVGGADERRRFGGGQHLRGRERRADLECLPDGGGWPTTCSRCGSTSLAWLPAR